MKGGHNKTLKVRMTLFNIRTPFVTFV